METRVLSIIDVPTGAVAAGKSPDIFRSCAIGSCVVISAYCWQRRVGGLAHIMLPGNAPCNGILEKTKYAENAIKELLCHMETLEADMEALDVCLVGAANVLKRPDDTVGQNNLDSVIEILEKKRIKIQAQSVGGTNRRSVTFDIGKGTVFYTEGDEAERLLWVSKGTGGTFSSKGIVA